MHRVKMMLFLLAMLMLMPPDAAAIPARRGDGASDTLRTGVEETDRTADSLARARHKRTLFHRIGDAFTSVFREFNTIDTNYIAPQRYNYTMMLQNTNSYERYRIANKSKQNITLAPEPSYRIGPYIGWRWVFLGYTVDLSHMTKDDQNRKELTLSLYSSLLGIDLFWRETGNNYKIRRMNIGGNIDTSPMRNVNFGGFHASIKGFNAYYVFNHRRFSYPAAYSQSTMQKRSTGSVIAGFGYTRHSLSIDWQQLDRLLTERIQDGNPAALIDSSLLFGKIHYTDVSLSSGYTYNWVFARNWLFNASLSLALGYKQSKADMSHSHFTLRDFNVKNFNLDGVGRFALVYNNMRWYAGMSSVFHTYNYSKNQFSTNSLFGTINIYFGVNFGLKREYRRKKS